jgi:hypothetical protein
MSTKHPDNHVSCIELKTHSGVFLFASVYLRPSAHNPENSLNSIFDLLSSPASIFCLDANARNVLWNSSNTDLRGQNFETIIQSRKLNIANIPKAELDFVPKGTSFVDITVVDDQINVGRWIFLEVPSLSNHPYIYFEISISPPALHNCGKAKKNLVPHFDVVDHKLFDTKLNSEIERWTSADSLVTHSAIELYADPIASSIATCAKSAKIPSVKKKSRSSKYALGVQGVVRSPHKSSRGIQSLDQSRRCGTRFTFSSGQGYVSKRAQAGKRKILVKIQAYFILH